MAEDAPNTIRLQDYTPPSFLIETVSLSFQLDPDRTVVRSRLSVQRNPASSIAGNQLRLDGEDLELVSLLLDGEPLDESGYVQDESGLIVKDVPGVFSLEIETICNPAANTKLEGLYVSNGTYCTQCEAEGFRRITYFLDRPDVMSTYEVRIEAGKTAHPVLLSNGNLIDSGETADGRHFAVWQDPFPKPAYLFALVAGDLACFTDTFRTNSGRNVDLKIWVEHGNEYRCAYAMDALKRSMKWDEDVYGLEYDLDIFNIVAVSDFNMGAMENKSLNVFNAKYILADPETATDTDYAGIEGVVAHEYFHNWTGNRVTCRDWFQLSLKEGLTVFRDQEFSADQRSRPVKRIRDVRTLRAHQFPEDSGPLAHPVRPDSYIEINNFYTATVYEKGAEVIRMIHALLGPDGFRKGMDLYFQRHDGQAVTCEDFVAAMEDATGTDLTQFRLWYQQAGTPVVTVNGHYDERNLSYEMTVLQEIADTPGQTDKQPMHIPLAMGLLDGAGSPIPLARQAGGDSTSTIVLDIRKSKQTFRFDNMLVEPVPSLNRHFSAPVKVASNLSDEQARFLMAHDDDPFARWEAGQQLAQKILLTMVAQVQDGTEPESDDAFIGALAKTLGDDNLDKAFRAEVVALPGESYLGEQMDVVDVDAIHMARQSLRRAISEALAKQLLETYQANRSNEPFSPSSEAAGQRALKNAALSYIGLRADAAALDLVGEQYANADNMTDRMAALAVLSELDDPARDQALDAFYKQWKDDPIVVDKWFALQAMSPLPGTLDSVNSLLTHPAFSLKNPNKVRALIGAFASNNAVNFHRKDGAGYAFLADRILELDPINPQIAARLVSPLGKWRRFDESRQRLMQSELGRILAKKSLSRDVYELAAKSLA